MDPGDVADYLARIGHEGRREPTLQTLRALHRAHLLTVPFENLDIHAGRRIELDGAAFHRKIVGERRGGFCYELNGLFGELLGALGFEVSLLSARVARQDGGFGPDFDHLLLLVELGGRRWIADVGFGRSFEEPMALDDPAEQEADGTLYRVVPGDDGWRLEARQPGGQPASEHTFALRPRALQEFAGMCDHHQTSPESNFTRKVVCSLPLARGGRITLSGRTLVSTAGGTRTETLLEDESAVAAALEEHFGVRMP